MSAEKSGVVVAGEFGPRCYVAQDTDHPCLRTGTVDHGGGHFMCALHYRETELEGEIFDTEIAADYLRLWVRQAELMGIDPLTNVMRFIYAETEFRLQSLKNQLAELWADDPLALQHLLDSGVLDAEAVR